MYSNLYNIINNVSNSNTMTKKCPQCEASMYPIKEWGTPSSQTDQAVEYPVWYCQFCKTTFQMEEQEEIEAHTLLFNSTHEELL